MVHLAAGMLVVASSGCPALAGAAPCRAEADDRGPLLLLPTRPRAHHATNNGGGGGGRRFCEEVSSY